MRFIFSALIWLVLIGGLSLYLGQRDAVIGPTDPPKAQPAPAQAGYALEITPTFGAAADPFALQDNNQPPSTLLVRLAGHEIYRGGEPLARGESLRIDPVQGLAAGANELYLEASPSLEEAHLAHALRIRVLREGVPVLDRTLWSEAGAKVAGTILFTLETAAEASHDH